METKTPDLEAKTADRGNKFANVDTKPVDRGHQLSTRDCLTLGQAAKTRPTINHTVRLDKKLTNRATQTERPKTPTLYAHNFKPRQPPR